MAPSSSASGRPREAKLFRSNRSQAVLIPAEFELPGEKALISRRGSRLIIEPIPESRGLLALLDSWDPLEEAFPDVDEGSLPLKDVSV